MVIAASQFDNRKDAMSTDLSPNRGFSLIEILVVLGMIAILMAILLPSIANVKSVGTMAAESTAARQQLKAYRDYANDHNGQLMPGYWNRYQEDNPATTLDEGTWPLLEAKDDAGNPIRGSYLGGPLAGSIAGRYPWRLAPYLDYQMSGMYCGDQAPYYEAIQSMLEPSSGCYLYLLSLYPSLGLNTMWLGGDTNYTAGLSPSIEAVTGRLYAQRMSEIRHPSRLIVFASAHEEDHEQALTLCQNMPPAAGGLQSGNFRVLSPRWNPLSGQNPWDDSYDPLTPSNHGFVAARNGRNVVTAMLDGSVDQEPIEALRDMRRWANQATSPDWDPFSELANP